jgi:glycosyltransferase involved in cell wall biosynthesis
MRRVVFVCPWFGIFAGGAERAVRLLAGELRRRGVDARVLTTCNNDLYGDWASDGLPAGPDACEGIPVERFPVNKDSLHLYQDAVRRWVSGKPVPEASQYDFFSHGISSDALVEHVGKLPSDVPVVTAPYFHALNFRTIAEHPGRVHLMGALHDEPQFHWRPVGEMFEKARGFLFLSPEEKQLAVRGYGLQRGRSLVESPVIGMGTELPAPAEALLRDAARMDAIRQGCGLPSDFFIAVGRKEAAKGVSRLVEDYAAWAAARASAGLPEIPLVFLGGGDDSLIPDGALFRDLGFVSEETKLALMRCARATLNLSTFESFSFVVMESWLCGTPVIVSSACAVTAGHVARSGGGYAVSGAAELGAALDRLCDPSHGDALGLAGRAHAREACSWDAVTDRFVRAVIPDEARPSPRERDAR